MVNVDQQRNLPTQKQNTSEYKRVTILLCHGFENIFAMEKQ